MTISSIFEALIQDHNRHRALLKRLASTDAKSNERGELFKDFRIEVSAHAAAEEESLYAKMLANPDLREAAQHSVSEHKAIEDRLEELGDIDPTSPEWTKTFEALRKCYEHHIDEEEEEMFPQAERELTDSEEKQLGNVFQERKPKEKIRAEEDS